MKTPHITDGLRKAHKTYLTATATKEKIANHLNPLLDAKLLEMNLRVDSFENDPHMAEMMKDEIGNKITKQDDVYLASSEDADRYYRACHEIYKAEGYNVSLYYCPIAIARSAEVEAEHKFIDEAMYLVEGTGLNRDELNGNLEARREFLALTLDLLEKID